MVTDGHTGTETVASIRSTPQLIVVGNL